MCVCVRPCLYLSYYYMRVGVCACVCERAFAFRDGVCVCVLTFVLCNGVHVCTRFWTL